MIALFISITMRVGYGSRLLVALAMRMTVTMIGDINDVLPLKAVPRNAIAN